MAFTVPNRPDTTHADQAEPDKGDFQNLGDRTSGVVTGGAVTRTATNTVTVGAITGFLLGEYFSISTDTVLNFSQPSSGSNAKFVLVLIQKAGSTFSATVLEGTVANGGESATNALYPDYNDSSSMPNSMLLAAVYYAAGATDITAASIVDKRVLILPQANPTVVTSTPGSAVGAIGEIRIDSNMTPGQGETRVYVKTDATTWTLMGAPISGVSEEEVQDIVGAMFTTDATHSGVSAVYDDAGGGIDLTGASSWNLTVAGSTEPIGDSETVAINISSDAEVSLSHSNGTITINDEWPRIRTLTNNAGATKPAHYLVSDPWGDAWDFDLDQFIYTSLVTGSIWPNTNNTWTCGGWNNRWSGVYAVVSYYQSTNNYSDRDLKQDFDAVPGLNFVNGLLPQSYTFRNDPASRRWGIVAQDVEALCAEQSVADNSLVTIDEGGFRNLNYIDLMAPLIKAVQELTTRVESLENG
tara:strand:+ start:1671 stop:3077 length:1407 start_codon:yes stop_codon:yes gene_type:complete